MERKKRSKGSVWEFCYANKIFGMFGFEMRACGQKLVKFCTLTHIHTTAAKLVVRIRAMKIWRVWSQNAINANVKKLSYPHEKIDDRQAHTIQLPFVCKMRCTHGIYHILQTNGSGIVFACLVNIFAGVTPVFYFGLYRVLWPNSSFVHSLQFHQHQQKLLKILILSQDIERLEFTTRQNSHHCRTTAIQSSFDTPRLNIPCTLQPWPFDSVGVLARTSHKTRQDNGLIRQCCREMKSRDGDGQWVLEGSKGGTDCESRDKENVRMVQATQRRQEIESIRAEDGEEAT